MNPYPLPGETVTRTLTAVAFGHGRPRDEPALPEIAVLFRASQTAWNEMGSAYQEWRNDRARPAFDAYRNALDYYESMYNGLLRALRRRPGHCYTCDGHRFWLHTEPGGCRRNVIRIEAIE